MLVIYRCPHCKREHRRTLVTKTREYICGNCEAKAKASAIVAALPPPPPPVEVTLPPVLKKPRKSRRKALA